LPDLGQLHESPDQAVSGHDGWNDDQSVDLIVESPETEDLDDRQDGGKRSHTPSDLVLRVELGIGESNRYENSEDVQCNDDNEVKHEYLLLS